MERLSVETQDGHDEKDYPGEAGPGDAYCLVAGTPLPHMAHGLQAEGVDGRSERSQIVGDQKNLNQHPSGQDEQANHKESGAPVVEYPR